MKSLIEPAALAPFIAVPPPGPLARALIESDEGYTSPSYTRPYPLAVRRASGCQIEDMDGNLFLDFTAGIAVCATGHCHPRVVEAVRRQAGELLHMCGADFYYPPLAALAQKLAELAPGASGKRVLFTNSGTESVEAAIKLARYHTGRPLIVAFLGGFHGRTLGALSLTASKAIQRRGFAPLMPGVSHAAFGDVRSLEQLFRTITPPSEVAAIVVEPIQGEGGYIVPPAEFHPELKEICRRHGILYVADEIQSGMGRTGRMFALEHWNVEPDILCLAKGLASGLPLGAIVARAEVMDWEPGSHASTFGGNPVSCAAALETIALLEEGLIDNAARQGRLLRDGLVALSERHPLLGDVRGMGLMLAVDVIAGGQRRQPDARERDRVIQRAFEKGLLLLGCGESAIRLCPPLIAGEAEVRTALAILDAALMAT